MGRKFTIFVLFNLVFEVKFQVQAPQGAYIRRGDFMEGFLRYDFGGLIFGGAYTWRGLFSEFYGILHDVYDYVFHSLLKLQLVCMAMLECFTILKMKRTLIGS